MTIYDIAKLAGVSASTVSRVVNGKSGVSRKAREKVEKLLRQYNYVPDENARSLVTQSSRTIGMLTDDLETFHQTDGVHKAESELMRQGYFCFVKYIDKAEDSLEDSFIDLARHRVAGAMCFGATFRNVDEVVGAVRRHLPNTPVIMVNNNMIFPLDNIYSIGAEEQDAFERGVEMMASRGRRNLALLLNENRISADIIQRGFTTGLSRCPQVQGRLFDVIPATIEGGRQAAQRVLDEYPEADGLICAHDLIAIGALQVMQQHGVRVPEQMAILGENNTPFCEVCSPALSSLDTMISTSSVIGARTLLDVLSKQIVSHRTMLQMEIVERSTT